MPQISRMLPLAALAGVAAGALWWYQQQPQAVAVEVIAAAPGLVEERVANTRAGTVKACRRAKLSPSLGGQIALLNVAEGDRVEPGDLLVELWNLDIRAEQALAEAEELTAQAKARAACLEAEVAAREGQRLTRLGASGAASEELIDKAVSAAKAAQATCDAAKAGARVAAAKIEVTRAKLARTELRAPFTGVVAEIHGELNEYVTPSPPGIPTPPVIDLIAADCFYIEAPIDEVDAARVRVGLPSRVSMDAFADQHYQGRVRRIADYVLDLEKQARTLDVEVELADPQQLEQLLPGYSADVEIILAESEEGVRIPSEAVFDDDQVLVFDQATGLLQQRQVRIGLANWDYTQVLTGLDAGERVVTTVEREGVGDGTLARVEAAPPE
jgi:HlyD family secretion protein